MGAAMSCRGHFWPATRGPPIEATAALPTYCAAAGLSVSSGPWPPHLLVRGAGRGALRSPILVVVAAAVVVAVRLAATTGLAIHGVSAISSEVSFCGTKRFLLAHLSAPRGRGSAQEARGAVPRKEIGADAVSNR
jgi:hypothetical protein